jgi:riboflavin synthase
VVGLAGSRAQDAKPATMFTGIVERVGQVVEVVEREAARQLRVDGVWHPLVDGESIAVNGVCLTVTGASPQGQAGFFVSRETLDRTNLGGLVVGSPVNLERATTLDKSLSGHLVQGHVDGLAWLERVTPCGESYEVCFALPRSWGRYCVEKGSIALNGVSLTINRVEDLDQATVLAEHVADASLEVTQRQAALGAWTRVTIMCIPHTWAHTNFGELPLGGAVNLEVDVLAKYVERLTRAYRP